MPEVSLRGGAEHQATAIAICFLAKGLIRFCTFFEKKYQKMWENRFEMVPPRPLQTRQGALRSPCQSPPHVAALRRQSPFGQNGVWQAKGF